MSASLRAAPTPTTDPWLTLQEAAAEVRVGTTTLRAAIKGGRLRAARISGPQSAHRIRRSWLDAYLEHAATGGPWPAPSTRVR